MIKKINILVILVGLASATFGQIHLFNFKQKLKGVESGWNQLDIPANMFEEIQSNYANVRIYGITIMGDTIEAPYFPLIGKEISESNQLRINTFNYSNNQNGYFYTFNMPRNYNLTTIELEVQQENFDWHIQLEGSHDQKSWYTIVNDTRMVGVKNNSTNYKYTRIDLPVAQYTYYRIHEIHSEIPDISSIIIPQTISKPAIWTNYPVYKFQPVETKVKGESQLEIVLEHQVPLSWISIEVTDTIDYYRPIEILYQSGETKVKNKSKPTYSLLTSGTLSSFEKGDFLFDETMVKKLRIIVHNFDNRPLNLAKVRAHGYQHSLVFKRDQLAEYFLAFGGKNTQMPKYDIGKFITGKEKLHHVELGQIQPIEHIQTKISEPFFKNQIWLWAIMGLIIILLGWFTVSMIKKA